MNNKKLISFVLGSYNRLPYLKLTIESIRNESVDLNYEIFVIDGGSDDGSLQWLMLQKDIITIVQHNRGEWLGKKIERRSWGYFMNLGFKCAQGKYICMLSDDSLLVPNAVKNGITHIESLLDQGRKIGAGAFYFRNWSQQESYYIGHTLGDKLYVNHGLYLREALQVVGYIDEDTFFFYNADSDLCLKMWQRGYEVVACPDSYVEHYPHANIQVRSTNYDRYNVDKENYFRKWAGIFYDRKKHNIGYWEERKFIDVKQTGERYSLLHKGVIEANPKLVMPVSTWQKIIQRMQWRYEAGSRRFLNLFR